MPKTNTAEALANIADSLKTLTETVSGIVSRVEKLEATELKKQEEPASKTEGATVSEQPIENPEHRRLVNEVLNKHFKFRTETDFAGTRFIVLIPKKYSNAPQGHWDTYHADERPSKPFLPHEFEVGFRNHLEKVLSNFNPDEKALITMDR